MRARPPLGSRAGRRFAEAYHKGRVSKAGRGNPPQKAWSLRQFPLFRDLGSECRARSVRRNDETKPHLSVIPSLPANLERLRDLATTCRGRGIQMRSTLFRPLDHDLWETALHNPVLMLGTIPQERLEEVMGR